ECHPAHSAGGEVMADLTLPERIDKALAGKPMRYDDLARKLFTNDRAWRHPTRGGPPGCYMALSAALRRGGFYIKYTGKGVGGRLVLPRKRPNQSSEGSND